MKARAIWLAIPLMVGVAFAQSTNGAAGQTQGSAGQPQSGSQPDRTGQAGSQAGSTSGTPAAGMSGTPAEMKTMTYRGTLVDLACGSATASAGQTDANTASRTAGQSAAGQPPAGSSAAGGSMAGAAGSANRASGDCPVTANSTQMGLKMDDGKVVRFDLVGNQRAQDALKTNKGWNKNLTANKPVKVKISGVLQGDKLIVSSIR